MHITIATAAGLVLAELIEEEDSDDVILSPLAQSIAVRLLVATSREMNIVITLMLVGTLLIIS